MSARCALIAAAFLITWGCTTPAIIATQSIQMGDRMNNASRYEEAIRHYEEFLRISPQLGLYRNPSQEADVSRKLAHAYSTQGKYRESFLYLSKALAIDTTLSANDLKVIDDYRELGVVKAYMGDYPEAMEYLNSSLILSEGIEKSAKDVRKISLADTYLSLAQVNLSMGNFKEAAQYGNQALSLYRNIPSEAAGLIETNLLLGIVNRDLGNLNEAIVLIHTSEEIARRKGLNTARHHQALSEIYLLRGEPEEGIRQKMMAIEEAEKSRIKPQIVMTYMRMGDAYQKLGDPEKAEYFYQKAITVKMDMDADTLAFIPSGSMRFAEAERAYHHYRSSGVTLGTALVGLRLGELREQNNDLDSAMIMFTSALDAFQKSGSNEGIAKANLELAELYIRKKNYENAKKHLRQASAVTIQPDMAWQIRLREGVIHENTGLYDSALSAYQQAITIIDNMRGNISVEEFKTLFANTKVEVYDRIILLLLKRNIQSLSDERAVREAFQYNEQSRSRTFLDLLGNKKIEPKDIADTALMEREQLLRLKIQRLTKEQHATSDPAQQKRLGDALAQTYREFDHVISNIKLNNPAYNMVINVNPPAIQEIQETLDPHTAILEYWVSSESMIIWTVTKENIFSQTVPVTKNDLRRLLGACRNGIAFREEETTNKSLKRLYELLISPVKGNIKEYKNLIIVPHRGLHFLPFQALITEKNSYLVEDYIITYAPASSIYYYCQQRKTGGGNTFLGMALGDLSLGNHAGLPGTKTEIEVLSQLYPHLVSKYGVACEETFLKEEIDTYDYVHIATHGVFNQHEPVYSYLLLSPSEKDDGRLTVNEIFGLDLRSRFVTLSACETALGELSEGDELVGLSRAFIYAGSGAVLVSLWKVEDNSTAWLMTRFHQYITSGLTPGEALAHAQRDMIHKNSGPPDAKLRTGELPRSNTPNTERPFFWAPFVLIGNGAR